MRSSIRIRYYLRDTHPACYSRADRVELNLHTGVGQGQSSGVATAAQVRHAGKSARAYAPHLRHRYSPRSAKPSARGRSAQRAARGGLALKGSHLGYRWRAEVQDLFKGGTNDHSYPSVQLRTVHNREAELNQQPLQQHDVMTLSLMHDAEVATSCSLDCAMSPLGEPAQRTH
jgi:hypothetical protein